DRTDSGRARAQLPDRHQVDLRGGHPPRAAGRGGTAGLPVRRVSRKGQLGVNTTKGRFPILGNRPLTCCAPEGIRTPNLLIRSQMLYPLSYGRSARPVYTHWPLSGDSEIRTREGPYRPNRISSAAP